jgi:hypothetical protein
MPHKLESRRRVKVSVPPGDFRDYDTVRGFILTEKSDLLSSMSVQPVRKFAKNGGGKYSPPRYFS